MNDPLPPESQGVTRQDYCRLNAVYGEHETEIMLRNQRAGGSPELVSRLWRKLAEIETVPDHPEQANRWAIREQLADAENARTAQMTWPTTETFPQLKALTARITRVRSSARPRTRAREHASGVSHN